MAHRNEKSHFPAFATTDLFIGLSAAAAFALLSLIQWDVGSGLSIQVQGWPFVVTVNHPLSGVSFSWAGLIGNLLIGVLISVAVTILGPSMRQRIRNV